MLRQIGMGVAAILIFGAAAGAVTVTPEERLGEDVVPKFEAIQLKLDASSTGYSGSVRVALEVRREVPVFRLHAKEIEIVRLALSGADGAIPASFAPAGGDMIAVTPATALAPGDYELGIDFTNEYNTQGVGLYRMVKDSHGFLFTQFEAIDARLAFPCWDEPAFKIPFQMTLEVPEKQETLTNTPVEKESVANGWKTIIFQKTKPLPTYLLAIASGEFDLVPVKGMTVPTRIVAVEGQGHLASIAAEMTPGILTALERYFESPYPYEKIDLIAVPEYWHGAMENPGLITFSDGVLLVDPRAASVGQRRNMARIIAHELAHMWFGDLVTMTWWDDLWLNESFAEWMGTKIVQQLYPEFGIDVYELQGMQWTMASDSRPSTEPIRRPVARSDDALSTVGLAYDKGQTVLGMFEQWIGPQTFRQGVNAYLRAHAWKNAVAADFWGALSRAAGKDLSAPMSTFIDQAGVPLVQVEVLDGGAVKLTQQRFANYGISAGAERWRIPVTLEFAGAGKIGKIEARTVLLEGMEQTVRLGKAAPAWVMPNGGASGYYRWSVPPAMLLEMAKRSEKIMDTRERVGFLGNLSALLDAGKIGGDAYLKVLGEFGADPDPQVVSAVMAGMGKVRFAFVPDELQKPFAAYVRMTLRPALDRFGMDRKNGEDEVVSTVRPQLLGWLGKEGRDASVLDHAKARAKAYMKDATSIDPALASVALELAALDGDRALFDEYKKRFETAQIPAERNHYLSALAAFRDPELRQAALTYVLEGPLRPNELLDIPFGISDTRAGRDRAYQWVTSNFDSVKSRVPPQVLGFLPFIASGCETERLAAAKVFFSEDSHKGPGTDRQVAKVSDQVTDCVALRQREGGAVAAYLARLP